VSDVAMHQTILPEDLPPREAYHLFLSIIAPRPIGWISTVDTEGNPNLAPYSFFQAVAGFPPTVMYSVSEPRSGRIKDSLTNARETGEFVGNVASEEIAEAMVHTSGMWEPGVNEFEKANLTMIPSIDVKPFRVAESPVSFECKVTQIVPVEGTTNTMVLGQVVRFHIREGLLRNDNTADIRKIQPVMRLGGIEYATIGDVFRLQRPEV